MSAKTWIISAIAIGVALVVIQQMAAADMRAKADTCAAVQDRLPGVTYSQCMEMVRERGLKVVRALAGLDR